MINAAPKKIVSARGSEPASLLDFRQQQWQRSLQRGFPTRKEELWKYTDLSDLKPADFQAKAPCGMAKSLSCIEDYQQKYAEHHLFIFVDGQLSLASSRLDALPKGVIVGDLLTVLQQHPALLTPYLLREFSTERYPFAVLNTALPSVGVFLQVPKNMVLTKPVHALFLSTESPIPINVRHIISAEQNSELVFIEEYASLHQNGAVTNVVTELFAGNNAAIQYYKIQNESFLATHMANTFIRQQQESRVKTTSVSLGGHLSRDDLIFALEERGAVCEANGFYYTERDGQHIDHHVEVNHLSDHTASRMLYKGILDNKSRAVFNGRVLVQPLAKQTESHQANHNLLLSNQAEIDAKPELEIYNDDLKCAHGVTVGQLNEEALFYLRARGIPEQVALQMLTKAFAADVIDHIPIASLLARIRDVLGGIL